MENLGIFAIMINSLPILLDYSSNHDIFILVGDRILDLGTIFAQIIKDPDILGQFQAAWTNFIKTGQVWALLIGIFFGYMFKSFTSY